MKKLLYAAMSAAIVLATAACGSQSASTETASAETTVQEAQSETETETTEAETTTALAEEGVTIEHSKGTTTVALNPKKSVVFDMGVLDILDSLGAETELAVPVDSLTSYLSQYADAVNAGGIKEPNLETIFEFEPDVIFISGRQADYYEELNKIAPTVYVDLDTETYMDDFASTVTNLGTIYGKADEAAKKLAEIEEIVTAGQEQAEQSEAKALVVLTNDGSISAYGRGSRFGIIHDVLGIETADQEIEVSTHGQEASYEYVAQINPDILYVIDRTTVVGGTQTASTTLDNELIQSTTAAQNGKIIYLDAEVWYLAGGGLTAVKTMVEEAVAALN